MMTLVIVRISAASRESTALAGFEQPANANMNDVRTTSDICFFMLNESNTSIEKWLRAMTPNEKS
jgi:hypothetical protein